MGVGGKKVAAAGGGIADRGKVIAEGRDSRHGRSDSCAGIGRRGEVIAAGMDSK